MLNTTKAFLFSLFEMFLAYIVLGNFLGWSGGAIAITGYTDVDWQNSYIGFESFTSAINDFNFTHYNLAFGVLDLNHFIDYLSKELNAITGGIPELITKVANGSTLTAWDYLLFFLKLLIQPLIVTLYFILILGCIFVYILSFIVVFFRFVGGAYNCVATSTDDVWSQWSYLSSEWDWSSILQVPVL